MQKQAQANHFAGDCAKVFLQAPQLPVWSEKSYIFHPTVNFTFSKQELLPQAFVQKPGS